MATNINHCLTTKTEIQSMAGNSTHRIGSVSTPYNVDPPLFLAEFSTLVESPAKLFKAKELGLNYDREGVGCETYERSFSSFYRGGRKSWTNPTSLFIELNEWQGNIQPQNLEAVKDILAQSPVTDIFFVDANHNFGYCSWGADTSTGYLEIRMFIQVATGLIYSCSSMQKLFDFFRLELSSDKLAIRTSDGQSFTCPSTLLEQHRQQCYNYKTQKHFYASFDWDYEGLRSLKMNPKFFNDYTTSLWKEKGRPAIDTDAALLKGVKKTYTACMATPQDWQNSPLATLLFHCLAAESGKTVNGVRVSKVFNDIFSDPEDSEGIMEAGKQAFLTKDDRNGSNLPYDFGDVIKRIGNFREFRKVVLSKQGDRAFSKLQDEYESLSMDEETYPLTSSAIKEGKIPVSTFFHSQEQYFLLNDNWDLWEGMLARDAETTISLANEVCKRKMYEKDLMSYFFFVLHALPEYLEKHTGKAWVCYPKLVSSETELDAPESKDGEPARQRSALTPIVDNENGTVVVPYASLAIPGRQTLYCYSHCYNVLTRGLSFNGNTVMNDLEVGLNGKDDYGLMYYTLTGSYQGRGYPTFLIIFERRAEQGGTFVHFHRTHPSRSKDGDYNPIHNWIRVCYNWMAGNVKADSLKAQQGDLIFSLLVPEDKVAGLDFSQEVTVYDHHVFEEPVKFEPPSQTGRKKNVLGHISLDKDTILSHNEHDDISIPAGIYEIRQCRSWEANPTGIWTLSID